MKKINLAECYMLYGMPEITAKFNPDDKKQIIVDFDFKIPLFRVDFQIANKPKPKPKTKTKPKPKN